MTHVRAAVTDADRAAARLIWDYHQMHHPLRPASAAIGLGCYDPAVGGFAAHLYHEGLFPVLVFSGADNPTRAEHFPDGEAITLRRRAIEQGVPAEAILLEPQATNTGQNITLSREVLHDAGITVTSLMLICIPSMQRRAYATCRKVWPEVQVTCASQPLSLDEFVAGIGDERLVLEDLVGDLQRVINYPCLGYAIPQPVPNTVEAAYRHLREAGYIRRVLKT